MLLQATQPRADRLRSNPAAPLNQGLLGWWRASGNVNGLAQRFYDLCGRTNIPFLNAPSWSGASHPNSRRSLRCAASESGVQITCPTYLRLSQPIHISLWMKSIGTPSNYAEMAGVTYTDSDTDPYIAYSIGCTSGGNLCARGNNGTGVWSIDTSTPVSSLTDWTHLAFEMYGGGAGYLYRNGIQVAAGSPFGSGPTYAANAKLFIGTSTPGTTRNINCLIDDVRIANRSYGAEGIRKLYQASLLGWPTEFVKPRRYWFPAAGASVFTASGALTVGAATASASASHTTPTYTASATLTIGAATASGSGTFSAGTKTASGTLTMGAATAAGSATFTPPVYTGSGAVTVGKATCAGSGTVTNPVYTASGAVSAGPATASGSATFSPGTKTATGAVSAGPATASGSATFSAGTKTATGALTIGRATCAGSGSVTNPTYTASGAVTVGGATLSGSAIFATVVYQASGAVTVGKATASGSATFTSPVYTASGAVTVGRATAAGSVNVTNPSYTASGAVIVGTAFLSAIGDVINGTFTGSASVVSGPVSFSGVASFLASTPAAFTGALYVEPRYAAVFSAEPRQAGTIRVN